MRWLSKVFKSHELYVISTTPIIRECAPAPKRPEKAEEPRADRAAEVAAMAIEEAARAVRLREEAQRTLDNARAQAEGLCAQAQADCEALREQARREGYEAGYEEGLSQGEGKAMEQVQGSLEQAAAHIDEQLRAAQELRTKLLEEAEPQVLELVLAVSEKILAQTLDESESAFREMVSSALTRLKAGRRITVRVCPAAYVRFFKNGMPDGAGADAGVEIEVEPDGSLSAYDCVVETEGGMTDAGLSGRLARVREEFGLD